MAVETKRTLGPWTRKPMTAEVLGSDGSMVASSFTGDAGGRMDFDRMFANAALISAAPDLLQAAQQAADALNSPHGKQVRLRVRDALLQAIAKATGAAA